MKKIKDMNNKRFSYLTVIGFHSSINGEAYWNCRCKCGNVKTIRGSHLRTGDTKSCGCLKKETKPNHSHGKSRTPEYWAWVSMKKRCYNSKDISYPYYGGRGIKVCDRWLESFENFFEDMGNKPYPKKSYSLDRIDSNKNYSLQNCRWATAKQQIRNRRTTRTICFQGVTKSIAKWAEETGLSQNALEKRLRNGWTVEKSITLPMKKRKPKK